MRGAAEDKGLILARALDPDVGRVMGDATRLQQVLWNLLTNSLKFTPPGGRIEITLRRRGAQAGQGEAGDGGRAVGLEGEGLGNEDGGEHAEGDQGEDEGV